MFTVYAVFESEKKKPGAQALAIFADERDALQYMHDYGDDFIPLEVEIWEVTNIDFMRCA